MYWDLGMFSANQGSALLIADMDVVETESEKGREREAEMVRDARCLTWLKKGRGLFKCELSVAAIALFT